MTTLIWILVAIVVLLIVLLWSTLRKTRKEQDKYLQLIEKKKNEIHALEQASEINQSDFKALLQVLSEEIKPAYQQYSDFFTLVNTPGKLTDTTKLEEIIQIVKHSSKQAHRFVLNLQDWVDLKTEKVSPSLQTCSVLSIVEKEIDSLSGQLFIKHIDVNIQILPEFRVVSDPVLLAAIFRNLIHNAVKFTPEDGSIELLAHFDENKPVVEINDSGIGMTEKEVAPMFTHWVVPSRFGTNNEKGIGLGFVIVREYMKLLNANLVLESEKDKGTRIKLEFA